MSADIKTVQPGETLVEIKNLKKYFPIQDGVFIKRTVANVKAVDDVTSVEALQKSVTRSQDTLLRALFGVSSSDRS